MREWVITNGIGGYAASTDFGGMNTRKYHGLLVASLNPPGQRRLVLSKVDESITIDSDNYGLYTNDSCGIIDDLDENAVINNMNNQINNRWT